jgi:hypothetical protein
MSRRKRSVAAVLGAAAIAGAAVVTVALAASGDPRPSKPTAGQLEALTRRIDNDTDSLERQGIFLGPPVAARNIDCVHVRLFNPTAANVAYVQRRYGPNICVSRKQSSIAGCMSAMTTPPIPDGEVVVPDLRSVRFLDAQSRLAAMGLKWNACDGPGQSTPQKSGKYSIFWLQTITDQCPRPGQHVPAGTDVALTTEARLPGGFTVAGGLPIARCVNDRQTVSG